ncbi:MAG: TrkH family potassium uptake protein [Lachnospiraceae bacterium]|nr:TrkH family potassium uptake protein [Lachnospiraceae bacterium]
MNNSIIRYMLGMLLKFESIFLLLPCLIAVIYGEREGLSYLLVAVVCAILGIVSTAKKPENTTFYLKEGCVVTALCWIILSMFGAAPLVLTGEITSFVDALFEIVSGFTTTGASILSDVEALSYTSNMWRCFTHWIGGMGVLVFILAIMPLNTGSHINIMKAESPGPSVGKLVPKVRQTARLLYVIYFVLTVVQVILLVVGDMTLYESLATAFGTAGTGGFGIKNTSIGGFSAYTQWVVTIFMILFGVNFNAYYLLLLRQFKKAISIEEVKCYFVIVFAAIGIIFVQVFEVFGNVADALRHSAFQVAAIITTTGFSTTDFNVWSQTAKTVLVMLMFIGACAGSTGGGMKVSRFMIAFKTIVKELNSYIHPRSVKKIKMDGKPIEHEVVRSVNVYFLTYMIIFSISVLLISFEGKSLVTNFTAIAATINNIGPGLDAVGPTQNFSIFSPFSKLVMVFDMLAGRLELFPLLVLFHPAAWKEIVNRRKKQV